MTTQNLDSYDLKGVEFGGLIREDVMQRIWDISPVPLPLTDLLGTGDSAGQSFTEWTLDRLPTPNPDNAKVDGADTINDNDTQLGKRVGNHCQTSTKTVQVSTRAIASDNIGTANQFARQIERRQQDLRRDVEVASLKGTQGSVAGDSATASRAGDLASQISTNVNIPGNATAGGFIEGGVRGYAPGTKRAGSYLALADLIEKVWVGGGNPTHVMSHPTLVRNMAKGFIDGTAGVAPLRANVTGENATEMVAQDSVMFIATQHGPVLKVVANRLQPLHNDGDASPTPCSHLYIVDPAYARHAYLTGYRTQPLAKTGLAEKAHVVVDWTLKALSEEAHGLYADIDHTAAWAA